MKIAVIHYHLRPGGLSRTISPTFRSLPPGGRAVFFTGEVPEADFPGDVPVAILPGLEEDGDEAVDGIQLADAMIRQARAALGDLPDVWHVFNPNVGKNTALPGAVAELARRGCPLFLHLADFAEDGRPEAYGRLRNAGLLKTLYPVGMHVHYGVINRRDYLYLLQLGISEFQLHYVPNPVTPPAFTAGIQPDPHFFLYAARAVRRKNLGELLLTAAVKPECRFGVTLPPYGAANIWYFDNWRRLSRELQLRIRFNMGTQPDLFFPDIVGEAAGLMSTSVAEGFGLGFLEPWLAGRPAVGRALPEVITEFGSTGIRLEHLYEQLLVPIEWIGEDRLRRHTINQWRRTVEAYGRLPAADDQGRIEVQWQRHGCVDFGFLDEELQAPIIRRLAADAASAAVIRQQLPDTSVDNDTIISNAMLVRQLFSVHAYTQRIQGIYRRIGQCAPETLYYLDPDRVLACFLEPERFALLCALA